MTLRAVSLFSNCGAGDLGFAQAGFSFEVMAELIDYRLDVALANHPGAEGVQGDLRETLQTVVAKWRDRHAEARPDLLAACPPCQGMSSARSGKGRHGDAAAGSRDPRNLLVQMVADAVDQLNPRAIIVENVPAFLTRQVRHPITDKPISAAVLLLDHLADRYVAFPLVTDLADYGVPQSRKRSFLTLIHRDEPGLAELLDRKLTPFPAASHADNPVTIRQALAASGLSPLDASTKERAESADPMHVVPVWDDRRYRMVAAIPPHTGQGAWANDTCGSCGLVSKDSEAATCGSCSKPLLRPIVQVGDEYRLIKGFRNSSYTRMPAEQPASTITTASGRVGSDNTIHPWENRLLSPAECALLQTFPATFEWGDALETRGYTHVRAMIGEAVPPLFTRQHGRVLASVLEARRPYSYLSATDPRVAKAESALKRARSSSITNGVAEPPTDQLTALELI